MSYEVRIFLGYPLTPDLKSTLIQNKQYPLLSLGDSLNTSQGSPNVLLQETMWNEKKYIGAYLKSPSTTCEINTLSKHIKSLLQTVCPKINFENRSIHLFSHLFLT